MRVVVLQHISCGPMGAYEDERHPWIEEELVVIADVYANQAFRVGRAAGSSSTSR